MADLVTTDVFKFLAVRPPQRVSDQETHRTIIRDPRATDPVGAPTLASLTSLARPQAAIASLARDLARPEAALARWREIDLSPLAPLVDAYRAVVLRYEKLRAADAPPDARGVLREAGAVHALGDPRILRLAWDALYVADSTGADAGPRLEGPMAALRVLHFAELLDEQTHPTRAAALDALLATPAIPQAFYEARVAPPSPPPAVGKTTVPPPVTDPEISVRSTQLRALAQEIAATERMLGLVTSAPALAAPAMQASPTTKEGGEYHSEFRLQSGPTLRAALTSQLSRDEASLLDRLHVTEAAPVAIAAQTLQAHRSKLSGKAFALADDQEFQGYMRDLSAPDSVMGSTSLLITGDYTSKFDTPKYALADTDNELAPDVDVSGRIVPLGIGDLKVVKQTLLAYVPGEVAHIENVLKGESKERKHRKLDRTETTLFTSEEETKETERDTQSTDRFELKRETEQTIKEDMSVKAGLTVTASYGPVVATATGDFAYSTSKQDSQKSSSNFARELVDRSVSKVQTKTKTERTTKTLNEVEEINTHGVNNTDGTDHVVGIYRWVDKRYRAQIYNYGIRLLLEFIVPEPAAFYRMAQSHPRPPKVNAIPPEPFESTPGVRLTVADITEGNYTLYASRYNAAGITLPPPITVFAGMTLVKEGLDLGKSIGMGKDFVIPEDYTLWFYSAAVSIIWGGGPRFTLLVGGDQHTILDSAGLGGGLQMTSEVKGGAVGAAGFSGFVPVSVAAYDVTAFTVNVQGVCLGTAAIEKWRGQTFDKIYAAYQALQTAYDQKVAQADAAQGIAIQGQNPATNRVVEKTELKKLCITMMTGQHFNQFNAMTDPPDKPKTYPEVDVYEALDEGRIEQFFEQAFEWEQMTYLYYPYFWGRKKHWVEVTRLSDPDPLFAQFLAAGAARVVVPVPIAYAAAVQFMLREPGTDLRKKVWRGGDRPTIDDKDGLYVSITDELRNQTDDLAGATPEDEPWEFTLPTTLVWLQPDATLPKFE